MATRSLFANLRRRLISSLASPIEAKSSSGCGKQSLKGQMLKLKSPTNSAAKLLGNWINEGHKVSTSELRHISRLLAKSRRYKHALEVVEWWENDSNLQLSAGDYATKIDLMIKLHGLEVGDEYFEKIPNYSSQKAASLPLLRGYVKERDVEKAEVFMKKVYNSGLIMNPHQYNEMMKLYMATSQCEKVSLVIQQMNQNKIPLNVLSYNLWLDSRWNEISHVEMIFRKMMKDDSVQVGWSTCATLANIYMKVGLFEKANLALKNAENKLSSCDRRGYLFLITIYTCLKNKKQVVRLWDVIKAIRGRITCANYMCILSCLVKLDDIVEAERVFMEWESACLKYDIRVSNVLLGAYTRKNLMQRAELLHMRTIEKGGCPNYKTWEILIEGHKIDKAIDGVAKEFYMLKESDS